MIPEFDYVEVESLRQAVTFVKKHPGAKIYAGGTDQLVDMRFKGAKPSVLVNINKVPGLSYIKEGNGGIRIGALTNLNKVQSSKILQKKAPCLVDATLKFGSVQVRNRATIAGNICHSTPSADMAPPLLVLNASARTLTSKGGRLIPLQRFFKGPGKNVLAKDEIVTEFVIPLPPESSGNSYLRLSQRDALDIAVSGVAAYLQVDGSKRIKQARVALGAVAPTPIRALEAEKRLKGQEATSEVFAEAGNVVAREAKPISDVRASADYRRQVTAVLAKRALSLALKRCSEN